MSAGSEAFKLAFQISPIILTGGVAQSIPYGMLPIILITQSISFVRGLLGGSIGTNLDDYFAHFQPMPGSTLIEQQIATVPFANQAVAANATIAQPLTLSMLMIAPVRAPVGFASKLATMMAMQTVLKKHNSLGGTYTVITPSSFNPNMILLRMADASNGQSHQAQNTWQLDFVAPLLTVSEAESAQGSLMSKLSSGTQISGEPTWSGLSPAVGTPSSIGAGSLVPAATGSPASTVTSV